MERAAPYSRPPEAPVKKRRGFREFWRDQFTRESSETQRGFDWVFGIVAPPLCLILDPMIFKGGFLGPPMLGEFQHLAYVFILSECVALAAWLVLGKRLGVLAPILGGVLLGGALFSAVLGLVLLPFSLVGTAFMGIGLLGLTPLLTAFVYFRNGLRAAWSRSVKMDTWAMAMLAMALTVGIPTGLWIRVDAIADRCLRDIIIGDDARMGSAIAELGDMWLVGNPSDRLALAYANEQEEGPRERLAQAYREITGEDIESRAMDFVD